MSPFKDASVAAIFDSYPPVVRRKLLALRELVFRTARSHPEVGELQETLKWGEPAYVTKNGAGSTLRMDWKAKTPDRYAMYFNCQTNLVESFRAMFPDDFTFEGNRALLFGVEERVPLAPLSVCVAASLRYHLETSPRVKAGLNTRARAPRQPPATIRTRRKT